jgi:hypothetical protein
MYFVYCDLIISNPINFFTTYVHIDSIDKCPLLFYSRLCHRDTSVRS